ncbi:hypothetical protein J3Q64DRAFT_1875520 [Phycomyces blakesleeanus]|uniref:DDE Tnp4 domain-containing protein n=2 Tax=Phycomyces blakesleeanus TaxID=4837 RepID=A0A167R4N7_PHYB8|nr:hypothetical protein PHYBLDRAFT_138384 [Phycomyces blakesleeanus NRRL 1555(-)]OAD80834.1 hypothetical protein PHYBLDRAFT_138384 [Phycomyces blakesleeanus NRRL 1555(-)]|eukprot:XP_018298874.1 hypothetical protein PHYBLDRAFT_138384 [Phycomyces blakesleeanus NRRL 1555(-)]
MNNINTDLTETEILAVYSLQFSSQKTIASDNDEDYEEAETEVKRLHYMREHLLNMHETLIQIYSNIMLAGNNHMTDDFQTVCYLGSPMHITAERIVHNNLDGSNVYWWILCHPHLHNGVGINSFRDHYRINRRTFNCMVNVLSRDSEFKASNERGNTSHSIWKQVAIVLWRLSNTHLGYRMASEMFGVSQAAYHRFTERFLKAMICCFLNDTIKWPSTIRESRRVMSGFAEASRRTGNPHLKSCIGAIDGKLVVVQKQSSFGNS